MVDPTASAKTVVRKPYCFLGRKHAVIPFSCWIPSMLCCRDVAMARGFRVQFLFDRIAAGE